MNLEKSLRELFPAIEFEFEDSQSLSDSKFQSTVHSANIICTATSSKYPLFKSDWVKEKTHLNLIGSYTKEMVEVEDLLIKRSKRIIVDSLEACLLEAGDLINANVDQKNLVEIGQLVDEKSELVQDEIEHVKKAGDITIFKSVGIGLQDVAIAGAVLEKAYALGVGTEIKDY